MNILNKRLDFHFPYLGKITILELILLVLLITSSAVGIFFTLALLPLFNGVFMPGSGGTAQMIMLTIFGPMFLLFATIGLGGVFGFVMLVRTFYKREKINNDDYENPIET